MTADRFAAAIQTIKEALDMGYALAAVVVVEAEHERLRLDLQSAEVWARTMEHERDFEQQVVTVDLTERLASAEGLLRQATDALKVYEEAVVKALRIAPNHWQQYRDPFELAPDIRAARAFARAAVLASVEQKDKTMSVCWLIERGQPEGHSPPLWWVKTARPGFGAVDLGRWVADPFEATRFATKAEAEGWLPLLARNRLISARAVEHGFTCVEQKDKP